MYGEGATLLGSSESVMEPRHGPRGTRPAWCRRAVEPAFDTVSTKREQRVETLDTGLIVAIAASLIVWGLVSAKFEALNVERADRIRGRRVGARQRPSVGDRRQRARGDAPEPRRGDAGAAALLGRGAGQSPRVAPRRRRRAAPPGRRPSAHHRPRHGAGDRALSGSRPVGSCGDRGGGAPTDAALGAQVVEDEHVPARIRRILNVESGLNDGIATPFVSFFIAGAVADTVSHSSTSLGGSLGDLGIGVLVGAAVGLGGGLPAHAQHAPAGLRRRRIGASESWRWRSWPTHCRSSSAGNGFISAFVGGLAFGTVIHGPAQQEATLEFDSQTGKLLSLIVWFLFGAVLVTALDAVTWQTAVFAILALTVVRMVPVAIALIGEGFSAHHGRLHRLVRATRPGIRRVRGDRLRLAGGIGGHDGARRDHLDRAPERGRARAHRGAPGTPIRRTCRRPRRQHAGARGGPGARDAAADDPPPPAGRVVPELEE